MSVAEDGAFTSRAGYVITPPDLFARLNDEFHFVLDPCPWRLRPDFDGLAIPWLRSNHVNMPYLPADELYGRGPMSWVRKAIWEQQRGNTSVLTFPPHAAHLAVLLRAGAEIRPLGRVGWLHAETGEPQKHGPEITCFILRGLPPFDERLHAWADRGREIHNV